MKIKHQTLITLILLLFGMSFTLSACSKNKAIVEIDSTKLTLEDFLYDIYLIEQERDNWNKDYKEILDTDYWDYSYEGITMEQLSKDTIMTRIVMHEILATQAKKEGYALSEIEHANVEEDVDKLLTSLSKEQLKHMNRDVLIKSFSKIALGDKYYMAVIDDYKVNEEAIRSTINPDEYREFITECLYAPTAKVSNQKITPFGEEEIKKAYDKIKDITYLIQGGVDFDKVLGQVDGIIHYERSFIISDNTAEKEYKEAAKELDNGEYSDAISTPFGYYIIHMLDNNSSKRYEQAVQSTIIEEKAAQFMIYYDDLMQEYDININSKYWDSIKLGSIISE